MDISIKEIINELVLRVAIGPMHFRFILQPTMAIIVGIRVGFLDAKAGAPPFLWALAFHKGRATRIRGAWRHLLIPVAIATSLDAIAQYIMFQHVRPLTALLVGMTLMMLPYSAARGISNRIRSRSLRAREERTEQRGEPVPHDLNSQR